MPASTLDDEKNQHQAAVKMYEAANKEKVRLRSKMHYASHKEEKLAAVKKYKAANKEKVRLQNKMHYASHKEEIRAYKKKYCATNAEKIAAQRKARYEKNRAQSKMYYQTHKEDVQAKKKLWNVANRAYMKAYDRARQARKKAIDAGKVPPPLPKLADFRAAQESSNRVVSAASTAPASFVSELLNADDQLDAVPHPLAAKKVVMVSFTNERPFNQRKRGPEPVCNECALFHPNALTSATNTVLLPGTYRCTLCRDWTYYRRHRKLKRTRADARLDALTA